MKWPEIVMAAVVFGGIAELTSRIEDWIEHRTPLLSPYTSQNDLLVRDADGVHGRRNATFEKWSMNGLGMRGPAADSLKPAGTVRVVTAGASEAFGVYESPDMEFPRQLEDSLNVLVAAGRCSRDIGRFEVLNAAFRGMTLPTVEQDLARRVSRFDPDVVVYYPTPTQYLQVEVPTAAEPDSTGAAAALAGGLFARMRFFHRFRAEAQQTIPSFVGRRSRDVRLRRALAAQPDGWLFESPPPQRLRAYEEALGGLVDTASRIAGSVVLATHANAFSPDRPRNQAYVEAWSSTYPRATGEATVEFDSLAALATERVAGESGVTLADVRSVLSAEGPTAFGDFSHFTDQGSGVAAGVLARSVIESLTSAGAPTCR